MADVRNQVVQNTGVVDAEDENELTVINGETVQPGTYPKTSGGMPEGTPPSGPPIANHDDIRSVEEALRRKGGAASHPDGPGVGGD